MAKFEFLLEESNEIVSVDVRDEGAFLDALESENRYLTRYAALAQSVRDTSSLDPAQAERTVRLLATWTKPHARRVHELTIERERLLKAAGANGAATHEPARQAVPAGKS